MNSLVAPIIIFSLVVLVLGTVYLILRPKSNNNPQIKRLLKLCSYGILLFFIAFICYALAFHKRDKNDAPFSEFKSFTMQWGAGDSLVNKYNSATGAYQFVDQQDSLIKMNVHLPKEVLLYLHEKALELGFWDWSAVEIGDTTERRNGQRPLRYVIQFNYRHKNKKVLFDESYFADQHLKEANLQLIREIQKVLADESGDQKK